MCVIVLAFILYMQVGVCGTLCVNMWGCLCLCFVCVYEGLVWACMWGLVCVYVVLFVCVCMRLCVCLCIYKGLVFVWVGVFVCV